MQHLFSVFDSKAEAFITPFFAPTIAVAMRMFEQACNDQTTDFHRYASDYTLFEVGYFDTDSGLLTPNATPKNLGLASTFVKSSDL